MILNSYKYEKTCGYLSLIQLNVKILDFNVNKNPSLGHKL